MAEEVQPAQPPSAPYVGRTPLWRSVFLPLLAIAAIAAAIWWLEYRPGTDDGLSSPSGERYGPLELPAALATSGLTVAAAEGGLAPDFLLETLDGGELRLSELRGKAVVLNFWATWCLPCRKEMPQMVAAYDRYAEQGLVVVAVNLQEDRGSIQRFASDFGMDFPIAIDRRGEVADQYRLLGLPTTYFIDREGVVRSVFRGPFLEKLQGRDVQGAIGESELLGRIREVME